VRETEAEADLEVEEMLADDVALGEAERVAEAEIDREADADAETDREPEAETVTEADEEAHILETPFTSHSPLPDVATISASLVRSNWRSLTTTLGIELIRSKVREPPVSSAT